MSLDHDSWLAGQTERYYAEQDEAEAFGEACDAEAVTIAGLMRQDSDECLTLLAEPMVSGDLMIPLLAGNHAEFGRPCAELLNRAIESAAAAPAPDRVRDRAEQSRRDAYAD